MSESSTRQDLILVGGGGHCRSCIDVIESDGTFAISGIIDLPEKCGNTILGYPIIGSDDDIARVLPESRMALVTIGQTRDSALRRRVFEDLLQCGARLPVVSAATAYRSKHSVIARGTILMHRVVVGPDSRIGENTIVNTGASIDHGAVVGSHCHISTGACINGDCRVGDNVLVGSNATLMQGIVVVSDTIVGAASVVVRSLTDPGIYVGNPARRIR